MQEAILNLANKLANKAPERQHPFGRSLKAVARDAYCTVSFQKTAAFAFILFFGGGSPTGAFLRRLSHRRSLFRWRLDGRFFRIVRRFSSWRLNDFLHGKYTNELVR